MVYITENFVTECLLKVKTFLNQYSEKFSAEKWYMDGWIKLPKKKREKLLSTYEVQCIKTKNLRNLHAADVRYHLDCWLV